MIWSFGLKQTLAPRKHFGQTLLYMCLPKGYTCNALPGRSPARAYYGIGLNGPRHGVHALLICTRKPVLERNHSAHPRPCCISQQKPNKAVLLQTVSVLVDGQETDLAVIGADLDTHDAVKENQVQRLMQHLMKRKEMATSNQRKFQAILVGDLNDRLVLKDDPGFKVMFSAHRNGQIIGRLSEKSQAILRHMMTTRGGTKEAALVACGLLRCYCRWRRATPSFRGSNFEFLFLADRVVAEEFSGTCPSDLQIHTMGTNSPWRRAWANYSQSAQKN